MFPHERSLVSKLKDAPFVLLGVNGDEDLESLKRMNEEQGITWRSFVDFHASDRTPISERWNVSGWPTLYLIDANGFIRHRWLGNPGDEVLDDAIERLIAEAKETSSEAVGD